MTTSNDRTVIIIGTGIAGLSAGCYLQMNGYKTRIFEMHTLPGGLCTSWNRAGYTIDGCMHWLVGSGPASGLHRMWQELGVVPEHSFADHDEYMRVEGPDGREFSLYADPDRLEDHMKSLSPADRAVTEAFTGALRQLKGFDIPLEQPPESAGSSLMGSMRHARVLAKWRNVTVMDFAQRFTDPLLRQGFEDVALGMPELPMLALLVPMTWVHAKTAGFPLGGSLAFARTIEQRYVALGGEVSYGSRVEKILVENDHAVGIRLTDGTEHHAGTVVSAADGRTTIFEMLDGRYIDETIRDRYNRLPLFPPMMQVAFGVSRTFEGLRPVVQGISLPLESPLAIAGVELRRLTLYPYHFDRSLAPNGCSVVKFLLTTDYDWWARLYQHPEHYLEEKERLAGTLLGVLDARFPGISAEVDVHDVATPLTFERYTGNWQGTFGGWMLTPQTYGTHMANTLPGLDGFYMAGQWVEPGGGVPTAAVSGRNVARLLREHDRKGFKTNVV